MRFIHTSDWHLGRSFHGVGLLGAQERFLDDLVGAVRRERVDAVLVSGDIYDRAMPAPETVALLSSALTRLVEAGAQVVLSSGNHDSATRLGFASPLLERAGVHVRTGVADLDRPVMIGETAVYPIPYLEPSLVASQLGVDSPTHADVLRAAIARIDAAEVPSRYRVAMAHAFVVGAAGSDSERDISVGGVSAVPMEVFDGFDYVALGHLHGRQRLSDTVRYSGSPVAMSFSEAAHIKGSLLVNLDDAGLAVTDLDAPVDRALAVLRGPIEELLASPDYAAQEDAWCQVTLTDDIRPAAALERIRARFPHTLDLRFEPANPATAPSVYSAAREAQSPIDVCCDFLEHVRGGRGATAEEAALVADAIEGSRLIGAEPGADAGAGADRADAAGAA